MREEIKKEGEIGENNIHLKGVKEVIIIIGEKEEKLGRK